MITIQLVGSIFLALADKSTIPPGGLSYPLPFWLVGIVVGALVSAIGALWVYNRSLWGERLDNSNRMNDLVKAAQRETIDTLNDKADRLEAIAEKSTNLKNSIDNLTTSVASLTSEVRNLPRN